MEGGMRKSRGGEKEGGKGREERRMRKGRMVPIHAFVANAVSTLG